MNNDKPKIIRRNVKHVFTPEETAGLHVDFTQAYNNLNAVNADFDSVKASYKAKVSEAESRMASLNATLQAGFEHRDKNCVVVNDYKQGKKLFYLETDLFEGAVREEAEPVLVEPMTDEDRQQELIEAERRFEHREEVQIFAPVNGDHGTLVVGRMNGRWYSALRVKIGTRAISERLDQEQPASRKRPDQVKRTLKRFGEWLSENLGREEAKGFHNAIELVKAEHSEREE